MKYWKVTWRGISGERADEAPRLRTLIPPKGRDALLRTSETPRICTKIFFDLRGARAFARASSVVIDPKLIVWDRGELRELSL